MAEQKKPYKISTGAFVGPGELKNRPDTEEAEPEGEEIFTPEQAKADSRHKPKLFWIIIPVIVLAVIICVIVILKNKTGRGGEGGGNEDIVREKYADNGFVLEESSLILLDRGYIEQDPSMLSKVCENIDRYSQAYFITPSEVILKEIKTKALVVALNYKQNSKAECELSFAAVNPSGEELASDKQQYLLKEGETVFINLDHFFEQGITWASGTWHIIVLIDGKEAKDFAVSIIE